MRRVTAFLACAAFLSNLARAGDMIRIDTDPESSAITFFSWNTGGGRSTETNLLRAGQRGRAAIKGLDGSSPPASHVRRGALAVERTASGAIIRISNCDILGNNTGISIAAGGSVVSFGNNKNTGNTTNGAPSTLLAQQ
jgi:hypothetical protein